MFSLKMFISVMLRQLNFSIIKTIDFYNRKFKKKFICNEIWQHGQSRFLNV